MSQMRMYCAGAGSLWVKVVGFQSSLDGQIQPSQTKQALHHYPRKATHQNVNFQLVCRDLEELRAVQGFIRRHQKYALTSPQRPEVVLWWPERGIENWSGIIKKVEGGDKRFNPVPKVSFTVDLVDSMLSRKTWWSSAADDFAKFGEAAMPPSGDWTVPLPSLPGLPPSPGDPGFVGPVPPQPPRVPRPGDSGFVGP